jgi:hypothetical protein
MSSAFYPQGMKSWNNTSHQGGYKTWKGNGVFSNPVGITATHVRPLTNNDMGNIFPTGFGLPRPIKHFRKGTVIPVHADISNLTAAEKTQIDYNVNRAVKSSIGSSLGGGNGGTGLISQLIDTPGSFSIKNNSSPLVNIDADCKTCQGIGLVSDWQPIVNLTEKPQSNVTNPLLCCNQQRKARQRVLPTSTNVKKNYYQTNYMYLYNRCQTFEQREFNFVSGQIDPSILSIIKKYPFVNEKLLEYAKPGSPLSLVNLYVAQCNPNVTIEQGVEVAFIIAITNSMVQQSLMTQPEYALLLQNNPSSIQQFVNFLKTNLPADKSELAIAYLYEIASNPYNGSILSGPSNTKGCQQVYYKPNNPQYAKQGSVSSSTRILKLNVDTISTNAAKNRLQNNKAKTPAACNPATYTGNPFFFQGQHQNSKICSKRSADISKDFVSVFQRAQGNYIGATQP